MYLKYRALYFGTTIPENTVVRWDADVSQKNLADCYYIEAEGAEIHIIRLNPVLKASQSWYKLTLLHEMAHLKLHPYPWHGKKFDEEMLRLACAGAFNGLW